MTKPAKLGKYQVRDICAALGIDQKDVSEMSFTVKCDSREDVEYHWKRE